MFKKSVILVAALLCSVLIFGTASAAPFWLDPTQGPYMTLGDPDQTQNSEFSLSQTPYLFLQFNKSDLGGWPILAGSVWYTLKHDDSEYEIHPVGNLYFADASDYLNIWQGLERWDEFSDAQKIGNWDVSAVWLLANGTKGGYGTTSFSVAPLVTPEPVSSALFLLGSCALVAIKRSRSKKA